MPLRRSPVLTPAALLARRLNSLQSTGPRTDRGKAWSCLNALRHGRRARSLRQKIERTGDFEALCLFDWFHANLINRWNPLSDHRSRTMLRLAGRVWCFMTGRDLRPLLKANALRTGPDGLCAAYRYGPGLVCPAGLRMSDKDGRSIRFRNSTPSRRKHVNDGWIPAVELVDPPPRLPKAKRVRKTRGGGDAPASAAAGSVPDRQWSLDSSSDRGNQVGMTEIHSPTKLESSLESAAYSEFGNHAAGSSLTAAGRAGFTPDQEWSAASRAVIASATAERLDGSRPPPSPLDGLGKWPYNVKEHAQFQELPCTGFSAVKTGRRR